ncbi:MAG TPA: AAA domain-containing protein [Polyangiales bacterium]|nr:AAA domain-containing protein [Polyangiales bacterium]
MSAIVSSAPPPAPRSQKLRELVGAAETPRGTEDILACVLPLLRQVRAIHEAGRVAPLCGVDDVLVTDGKLWFENAKAREPKDNRARLRALQRDESSAFSVVGHARHDSDLSSDVHAEHSLDLAQRGSAIARPVYLAGYVSWEHEVDHHDALTDVFVLGLILGSVATDLDLADEAQLETFLRVRRDIRAQNDRVHPVLARVVMRMTELNRHARAQDLASLILALERYREQGASPLDLSEFPGLESGPDPAGRRAVICEHLRNRLFDVSRRNRLLHFKPSGQTLNLTEVSVPLLLDYQHLAPEKLLTWQGDAARAFSQTEPVQLGKWLRFEDYPFLPGVLDTIRTRAARDQTEYGFSSLRLVLCFLHWHNLKEAPEDRVHSPLLLLPATLAKKKGVRDAYVLTPSTDEAEVNPVLRQVFRQLYAIELPQFVDLTAPGSVRALYDVLVQQVEASEPGVSIDYLDKPRIELIQARVKRRLESFRKRSFLTGRGVRRFGSVEYSYREDNFQPLGLRLFLTRVSPSPAPLRDLVEAPRPKRLQMVAEPGARELERQQYALRSDDADATPYRWAFDLCGVTLGNFNYQKITLVRDYAGLLEEGGRPNAAFDSLFSPEPRHADAPAAELSLSEQFAVVPADPSQLQAIARARGGASYIIQGPPGTGKSQTITNLIADYVARGKRVLFVCEKRAAIDVVYHRLKQHHLDALACLIHDSQEDKKAFIQDLKQTYEAWSVEPQADVDAARARCLEQLGREYQPLDRWTQIMTAPAAGSQLALGKLLRRAVELSALAPKLSAVEQELLPSHAEFAAHSELLLRAASALEAIGAEPVLAKHPARLLSRSILDAERPVEALTRKLAEVGRELAALSGAEGIALRDTYARVDFAVLVRPLVEAGLLALIDAASSAYQRLQKELDRFRKQAAALAQAKTQASGWRDPLPRAELATALELAQRFRGMLFRFLFPSFWRLRRILRSRYDFGATLLPPSYVQALEQLAAQYAAEAQTVELERELAQELGVDELEPVRSVVEKLHAHPPESPVERELRAAFAAQGGEAEARALLAKADTARALRESLAGLFQDYEHLNPEQLARELQQLEAALSIIPELVPVLRELDAAPEALRAAAKQLPLTVQALEAAVCEKASADTLRASRDLAKLDAEALANARRVLGEQHGALRAANARAIVETCRGRFSEHVRVSSSPAAGLSPDDKALKKDYAAGRRELEHEFGKVMRFKSIRDLMSNRTGAVIRDLKPIWLMSPLSVADTLPCSAEFFDVVIFDEASQIPLEDAMPAIYRAEQCIIVGDRMQLPPTSFFAAARSADEDRVAFDENDENVQYELDAESLLSHAARSLPSTLLEWHYRSRDEALISFCNDAFYLGRLLTIPTPANQEASAEIRASEAEDGKRGAHEALARAVSFHRLERSPYENRRNPKEARYIAQLVRELLAQGSGASLGIVAFSEAQQDEIERALNQLAAEDAAFRSALDAELEREEDEQFCGLFVKNLENVQGDERDMIILSVCYAPDAKGRMVMNFGPINKNGGEKRLNVIFSRAKRHVAVVSSIDYTQITNEYNDGASTLRAYLRYAAAASRGDTAEVRSVLSGLSAGRAAAPRQAPADSVKQALAAALRERGYELQLDLGSSRFRCDIAVRPKQATDRPVAVLVDSDDFYRTGTSDERFRLRPAILEAFGWRVEMVLGKDWFTGPAAVLKRIEAG